MPIKKGETQKKYTDELISKILHEFANTKCSALSLSKKYNIPDSTIQNWAKCSNGLPPGIRKARGRPRKDLTNLEYKERYEILKKYQAFLLKEKNRK